MIRKNKELLRIENLEKSCSEETLLEHREIEIALVLEGSGSLIISGCISNFRKGDVFVIGPNIPHCFRFYHDVNEAVDNIVRIFVDVSLFRNELFEYTDIHSLFINAKKGIKLKSKYGKEITHKAAGLINLHGLDKIIGVMSTINLIIKSPQIELLNTESLDLTTNESNGKRLNDVIQFTFNNYNRRITIEEAAHFAHMIPSSFCRFFKQRMQKSYIDFLNEMRIRNACKLLMIRDIPISEISQKSGYRNLAYFNRKFKKTTGYTPTQYQSKVALQY